MKMKLKADKTCCFESQQEAFGCLNIDVSAEMGAADDKMLRRVSFLLLKHWSSSQNQPHYHRYH